VDKAKDGGVVIDGRTVKVQFANPAYVMFVSRHAVVPQRLTRRRSFV